MAKIVYLLALFLGCQSALAYTSDDCDYSFEYYDDMEEECYGCKDCSSYNRVEMLPCSRTQNTQCSVCLSGYDDGHLRNRFIADDITMHCEPIVAEEEDISAEDNSAENSTWKMALIGGSVLLIVVVLVIVLVIFLVKHPRHSIRNTITNNSAPVNLSCVSPIESQTSLKKAVLASYHQESPGTTNESETTQEQKPLLLPKDLPATQGDNLTADDDQNGLMMVATQGDNLTAEEDQNSFMMVQLPVPAMGDLYGEAVRYPEAIGHSTQAHDDPERSVVLHIDDNE